MRAVPAAMLVLVLAGGAEGAFADEESPGVQPDVPASVDGKLEGTLAHLVTTWTVPVTGPSWAETHPEILLPQRVAVTGGTVTVRGQAPQRLELRHADQAHAAFEALIASTEAKARGWAVGVHTIGDSPSNLSIDVAAPRSTTLLLSLDLVASTCFYRDMRIVELPESWRPVLSPALRRQIVALDDIPEEVCQKREDRPLLIALPSPELALRPVGDARIGGIAMSLPLATEALARVELDLSSQISGVPADLHTVFLLDASRSVQPREADAQRAILESYMRNAPSTHVNALAYARKVTPLLPAWTIASQASSRIERAAQNLAPANGSNLDAALAEAGRLLEQVSGTRRIVLFSDERLAGRIIAMPLIEMRRVLPPGTIVQVVSLDDAEGPLERDDDAFLASLAAATDGISVSGHLDAKGGADAKVLVRPIALDQVTVTSPGWSKVDENETGCSGELPEGSSCVLVLRGNEATAPITIEGLLWGRRFTRVLRPDPAQARTLARVISTTEVPLEEDELAQVAEAAQVVNKAWALFRQWGPSGGYGDIASDLLVTGTLGVLSSDSVGTPDTVTGTVGHGDRAIDLGRQLESVVTACHAQSYRVEADIETTRQEIVDVQVQVQSLISDRSAALGDCISERIWDTMLAIPDAPDHAHYRAVL